MKCALNAQVVQLLLVLISYEQTLNSSFGGFTACNVTMKTVDIRFSLAHPSKETRKG